MLPLSGTNNFEHLGPMRIGNIQCLEQNHINDMDMENIVEVSHEEIRTRSRNIKYFKFLNFPTEQEGFVIVVKEVWDNDIMGNPMWTLQNTLKIFSKTLIKWSKECIGDTIDVIKHKEGHNKLMEKK